MNGIKTIKWKEDFGPPSISKKYQRLRMTQLEVHVSFHEQGRMSECGTKIPEGRAKSPREFFLDLNLRPNQRWSNISFVEFPKC